MLLNIKKELKLKIPKTSIKTKGDIEKNTNLIGELFDKLDTPLSKTSIYNKAKETGNTVSKFIDEFIDFVVPK